MFLGTSYIELNSKEYITDVDNQRERNTKFMMFICFDDNL
jgi:hypothetical protein